MADQNFQSYIIVLADLPLRWGKVYREVSMSSSAVISDHCILCQKDKYNPNQQDKRN